MLTLYFHSTELLNDVKSGTITGIQENDKRAQGMVYNKMVGWPIRNTTTSIEPWRTKKRNSLKQYIERGKKLWGIIDRLGEGMLLYSRIW